MRRRQAIVALAICGGCMRSVVAQQTERVRRVVLLLGANDEFWQAYVASFEAALRDLGWTSGRNLVLDKRFTGQDAERMRAAAREVVAQPPDVVFATTNPVVAIMVKETRTIPIVFSSVSDSVGSGIVANLGRPGGNVTGFHNFESDIAGKWVETLKQIAPAVRRAAFVHDPAITAHVAFVRVATAVGPSLAMTIAPVEIRSVQDYEPAIAAFAKEPNGGFIVAPNPLSSMNRDILIGLAARFSLPAVYPFRYFCESGGLVSYGIDRTEQARQAATYVDRILRGASAGDLPVQLPRKFELVINARTAKSLGLSIPAAILSRADEVIQ